ncbi:PAS/PAC sensor signal transduction histidine kinase [Halanaeroarchaeum sulfurireducens]|uniref:PAS/PAC sensor signal transduction histidine kinase n=1 Tax=Halanaeroarchaeum sulfurireducens TaxID=1604004 RepID=A0A0N9MTI7_9EURY|nr:PAS/PAC sensor signal transduction histidine kinase [Halanaeroarchaeum sulfurireducens]
MDAVEERAPTEVLVVASDVSFARRCERNLSRKDDFVVETAGTVEEAIGHVTGERAIDCIVSEFDLPETDGIAFLEMVRAHAPAVPFILVADAAEEKQVSHAVTGHVTDYFLKEDLSDDGIFGRLIDNLVAYYREQNELSSSTISRAGTLLDHANDMIAVLDAGQIRYINQTGVGLLRGEDRAEFLGQPIAEWLDDPPESSLTDRLRQVQRGKLSLEVFDQILERVDGTALPVAVYTSRIDWTDGPAVALIIRDVESRKRLESELSLKNRAIDTAPIGITIADMAEPDNPLVYANDHFLELTGYAESEVLGRNSRFLQGEDTDPEPVARMREAIEADESVSVELRNYRKDGCMFWNRVTLAPIENAEGDVTHYLGFQEDVTERVAMQQRLRRFKQAVEAAGHAIYLTKPDGTITYVNPAFERITG